jgi:hypothetical protein
MAEAQQRPARMKDFDVVEAFVAFLAANGRSGLKVDYRPEKEKDGEIEAVAGDVAIEHTSIDTLENQRRDSERFRQLVDPLEGTLPKPTFSLHVILGSDAVRSGQDWPSIRAAVKDWLTSPEPQTLAVGSHPIELPGVPFRLTVMKWTGGVGGIYFGRFDPGDTTLPQRIKELCERKVKKLAPWSGKENRSGKRCQTVLLLESDDIAMMNHIKMAESIRAAYPGGRPSGVDQLWYANTTGQNWPEPELEFLDMSGIWRGPIGMPIRWRTGQRSAS